MNSDSSKSIMNELDEIRLDAAKYFDQAIAEFPKDKLQDQWTMFNYSKELPQSIKMMRNI